MPSFGATGALFARHFDILRTLNRRILLLKQAFEFQADQERSLDHIRGIIAVLDKATKFLSFDHFDTASDNPKEKKKDGEGADDKESNKSQLKEKEFYEDDDCEDLLSG